MTCILWSDNRQCTLYLFVLSYRVMTTRLLHPICFHVTIVIFALHAKVSPVICLIMVIFKDLVYSCDWPARIYYSDVIMRAMTLQSPAPRLIAQPFVQAQITEATKAPHHWPLWGESTGDWWIPLTKASNAENVSIWWRHNVIGLPLFFRVILLKYIRMR